MYKCMYVSTFGINCYVTYVCMYACMYVCMYIRMTDLSASD